jgi:hypothetical protein
MVQAITRMGTVTNAEEEAEKCMQVSQRRHLIPLFRGWTPLSMQKRKERSACRLVKDDISPTSSLLVAEKGHKCNEEVNGGQSKTTFNLQYIFVTI